jgi:hypothetical protein
MERSIDRRFTVILVENTMVRAAVCERCGAKIYPTKLLQSHLLRHQFKQHRLQRELKELQFAVAHFG